MQFETRVSGIPCICKVTHYSSYVPMRITGSGFGDAEPPEPAEFEYVILDMKGRRAEWLEKKITDRIDQDIFEEYVCARTAEKYGIEY